MNRPGGEPGVVHVISTPRGVGGAERLVADLVHDGRRRGRHDLVLNPFAQDPDPALAHELPPDAYRSFPGAHVRELPRVAQWLRRELRRVAPDVVHAHLFHAAALVATLPRPVRSVRLLTHHHGDVLLVNGRRVAQRVDDLVVRRFDRVAAVSVRGREFLVGRGASPDRVQVVPNGWRVPPDWVPPRAEPHPPTVICVANLRPEKDHETLLRAFALVRGRVPAARLRLLGDGPRRAAVAALAVDLELRDAVDVVGRVARVWDELAAADVFVLSSRYEGMSIALLEALGAGLPAVVTDVGGNAEVVGREAGVVVAPGDVEALAAALVDVLGDGGRRRELAAGARRVAERYRLDATLDAYDDLYRSLTGTVR